MITRYNISNFKGFASTGDIELAPITILIGKNSGGKSSILQSIALLSQSIMAPNREKVLDGFGPFVDLGLYKDFVYNNDYKNKIDFNFSFRAIKGRVPLDFRYVFQGIQRTQRIECIRQSISSNSTKLDILYPSRDDQFILSANGARSNAFAPYQVKSFIYDVFEKDDEWDSEEGSREKAKFSRNIWRYTQFLINLLENCFFVGPLRANPKRYYELTGHNPHYVGPAGENAVHILLSEYQRVVRAEHRLIVKQVNQWLEYFSLAERVDLQKIADMASVRFPQAKKKHAATLPSLGFGVSQIFPIIVQSAASPQGSVHLFEQPEIHIHPAIQAKIADLFVHYANNQEKQFVVETHSEHFVRGMQLAIAKGQISNKKVALYYVDCSELNSLRRIEIDSKGNLSSELPIDFYNIGYKLTNEIIKHQLQ